MKSPSGATTTFLTPAAFLLMVDAQVVAQLLATGEGKSRRPVAESALATNERLWRALLAATGRLESACLRGERYTASDLGALTGASAAHRDKILRDFTMAELWDMREDLTPAAARLIERAERIEEQLTRGERIFSLAEVQEAGLPASVEDARLDPDQHERNQGPTVILRRYFGRRGVDYQQE